MKISDSVLTQVKERKKYIILKDKEHFNIENSINEKTFLGYELFSFNIINNDEFVAVMKYNK